MDNGVDIGALAVAYQQQYEAVRTCERQEPPYENSDAHERWKVSMAELREDLGKAHLEIDVAVFGSHIPTLPGTP